MHNNFINKRRLLNNFLCCLPYKFPINNSHYITGKELSFFSNIMCIESELSKLTCCCNNMCKNIKMNFKR